MRIKILACKTLEAEINRVLHEENEEDIPVVWIESGLHNYPKKLHARLQEEIDKITDCDRLLLFFGHCGDSVNGLVSGDFEMVIPKFSDCISLLMGSDERRNAYGRENAAYYLTEGWMRGERNLWVEYQYTVDKYGEEQAKEITEMMYAHYRTLALLDTGTEPIDKLYQETEGIEKMLGMKRQIVPASVDRLRELLRGTLNPQYYDIVKPGETFRTMPGACTSVQ